MARAGVPDEVHELIHDHLGTNSGVDVLLLLHRRPGQSSTPAAVARELRIHPDQAAGILARLAETGLLRAEGAAYRYCPVDERLGHAVDALSALHPSYRVAIADIILGKAAGSGNAPMGRR